ncbi:sensor histidine kinase [Clostridium oceanicum]|uniref:GHKL domain-containing protein n=1 Tax=Clostridium oceanicum TaxID=1543 RepID=A0ABP3UR80_9CLOT
MFNIFNLVSSNAVYIKEFTLRKLITEAVLDPLSVTIICFSLICILYKNKLKIVDLIRYFFISFIIIFVVKIGSYLITLPLLAIVIISETKKRKYNDYNILIIITIFTVCFLNVIYEMFFDGVFYKENNIMVVKSYIAKFIVMVLFVLVIFKIIEVLFNENNKKLSSSNIRNRMILSISVPIGITIALLSPFVSSRKNPRIDFIVGEFIPMVIPSISMIFILIVIYNYDKNLEKEVRFKREVEEKKRIEEYASMVESMYSETRKFKHDYANMLISLKGYMDTDNMENLKNFFYKNVINMDKNVKWNNSNVDKLKYIKESSLKAILSTKVIKAISMKIDIKVEIVEDIYKVNINSVDLCRIVGILMDNAIEACLECEFSKLYLCVFNKGDYVAIVINNNFSGEKPMIHKIYKEGFSTKGKDRGLGLSTVKKLLDEKYKNVFINTSVENNLFVQELWIKNNKKTS